MQVSHAAMVELIREAEMLGSLRHPNVVWVYGVVLPRMTDDLELDADQLCEDSVDIATCTAFSAHSPNPRGQPGVVRPPAIVTEFLSQGSLRGVLSRKSDLLQGSLVRVLIAMDAAKVGPASPLPAPLPGPVWHALSVALRPCEIPGSSSCIPELALLRCIYSLLPLICLCSRAVWCLLHMLCRMVLC